MKKQTIIKIGLVSSLGLTAFVCAAVSPSAFGLGVSGAVRLNAEVATAIAMKIASPNDTNPDCMTQSGVTYGTANRYATSNGAEGSKQVDTFDGTTGGADEVNSNTSCATLTMNPNAFSSTYSDVTVYTNSPTGYSLTVRSADNTSPNLVNTTDPTQYIPAAALTEVDGTIDDGQGGTTTAKVVPGGQNKWALKSDSGLLDTWTPVATTDTTVRAYDQETHNGSNTRVTYGISSGNNPTGKYATTLTYTATMFDGPNPNVPAANIVLGTGGSGTGGSGSGGSGSSIDPTAQITLPERVSIPYGETRTIPVIVNPGYEIESITCENGFDCANYNTGSGATGNQTIDITNNSKTNSGTITIVTKPIDYPVTVPTTSTDPDLTLDLGDFDPTGFTVPYGQSKTIPLTISTDKTGYELSITCSEGYTCTIAEDPEHPGEKVLIITNNNALSGASISFGTKPIDYEAPISIAEDPDLSVIFNEDFSPSTFTIPYGQTKTIPATITTKRGYEPNITCGEGYTCTIAEDPEHPGSQIITITNNGTTSGTSITISAKPIEYPVIATEDPNNVAGTILSLSDTDLSVPYGQSKTIFVTPHEGYSIDADCPEGYTCEVKVGENLTTEDINELKKNEDGTMQSFSAGLHSSDTEETTYTFTDSRDGQTYTAAKLKDGNIWMTQNLRLVGPKTLTSADSNVSSDFTLTASNSGKWCTTDSSACDNQSMVLDSGNATYGTYYNWYAATAGTGTYSLSSDNANATSSICPKGWRLPTGGSGSEFQTLYNNYSSSSAMMGTPAFVLSGLRYGSSANSQGSRGHYWSSTAVSSVFAYNLYLNSSDVLPQDVSNKYVGLAVRCVADNSTPLPTAVTITNNDTQGGGSVSIKTKPIEYNVAIAPSLNATVSTNDLKVPYGESRTFTLTPAEDYYLYNLTCSDGYTCSGYTTGYNSTAQGAQTITVTNNNKVGTGAISYGLVAYVGDMQSFSASTHSSDPVEKTYFVRDSRDNNVYTVTKLADNNWWMIQNLRLVGSRTLTSADSNVSSNFTLTASDSGKWCTTQSSACYDQSMVLDSGNTTYGAYYNWYAATAGTGTYSLSSGNATSSICPKGWRLPTGGSGGEFQTLYNNYKSPSAMMGTPAFVLSGRRIGSSTSIQGSNGFYWSSTAAYNSNSVSAYYLELGSSGVNPQISGGKYSGLAVRCVASS